MAEMAFFCCTAYKYALRLISMGMSDEYENCIKHCWRKAGTCLLAKNSEAPIRMRE